MSIRERIQDWLGITQIHTQLGYMDNKLMKTQRTLDFVGPGLGRVIAKLDAKFAESELSPERRAESDRLGDEVIKRLEAEVKARAPYNDPT